MRPSWIPVFLVLIAIGCGVFTLFPPRWSPDPAHGILAGMVMYFVAFTRTAELAWARTGEIPPVFGPGGILAGVIVRALAFLVILAAIAYVYFDRRSFFDVTWPVLILAAWNLADGMVGSRGRAR